MRPLLVAAIAATLVILCAALAGALIEVPPTCIGDPDCTHVADR